MNKSIVQIMWIWCALFSLPFIGCCSFIITEIQLQSHCFFRQHFLSVVACSFSVGIECASEKKPHIRGRFYKIHTVQMFINQLFLHANMITRDYCHLHGPGIRLSIRCVNKKLQRFQLDNAGCVYRQDNGPGNIHKSSAQTSIPSIYGERNQTSNIDAITLIT